MRALPVFPVSLLFVGGLAAQAQLPDNNPNALRGVGAVDAQVSLTWDDEINRRGGPNRAYVQSSAERTFRSETMRRVVVE